jgi:hypothetical protein
MSDPITSGSLALTASWSAAIWVPGLQKLDICIYGSAALCQFHSVATDEWTPDDGVMFDANLFRSLPGLDEAFAKVGGVDGIRFKLADSSGVCNVTFHTYTP